MFLFFYHLAILWLMATCFLSLFCYTNTKNLLGNILFILLFGNFFNNVIHISLISFAIYKLSEKAAKEDVSAALPPSP